MTTHANCILLEAGGRHYYAEEFGKFIQITLREHEAILTDPNLYHTSTALLTHLEWCAAVGREKTITFSTALGHTQSALSKPNSQGVSHKCAKQSSQLGNGAQKKGAWSSKWVAHILTHPAIHLTDCALLCVAIALAILVIAVACSAHSQNNALSYKIARSSPEIECAVPVEQEVSKAIAGEPEIRKAIPVDTLGGKGVGRNHRTARLNTSSAHHHGHLRFRAPRGVSSIRNSARRSVCRARALVLRQRKP